MIQTAPLNSPQPSVVAELSVGDELDLDLAGSVLRVLAQGRVAGSLTHRGHAALIDCMARGHVYVAVVTEKSGPLVTLRVHRA